MIVQGIPTQTSLRFWVSLEDSDGNDGFLKPVFNEVTIQLEKEILKLDRGPVIGHLYFAENLVPDTEYNFQLKNSSGNFIPNSGRKCKTLPDSLENYELPISLGSCYWNFSKSAKYGLVNNYPPKQSRLPRFRFLAGDQIYNDCFSPGALKALSVPDTYDNYMRQWNNPQFINFLTSTPTAVLADDHEYWNNYPHYNIHQASWQNAASEDLIRKVTAEAYSAFSKYQLPLNPFRKKSFKLNFKELSFFVLDTRVSRTTYNSSTPQFIHPDEKTELLSWLRELETPGVIVMGDLIADETSGLDVKILKAGDCTLADYGKDYYDMWKAMLEAKHDILVLAGDVHYNSLGYIDIEKKREPGGTRNGRVYECVCSALSVLDSSKSCFDKKNKLKDFDISGSLKKNIRLRYRNIFPYDDNFSKEISSFAMITFIKFNGGIEFQVVYYNSENGNRMYNSKLLVEKHVLY